MKGVWGIKQFHAAALKGEKSSSAKTSISFKPAKPSVQVHPSKAGGLIPLKNQMTRLRINGDHKLTNKA